MGRRPKTERVRRAIPAVQKAFAILELFCSNSREYTLSQVSRILGFPITTSSSLLHSLVYCGYLNRDEKGCFSMTMKLLTEATKGLSHLELRNLAQPVLERLTTTTGIASVLSVQDGNQVICADKVEGSGHIKIVSNIGSRLYMHASSTGKAILAHLPSDDFRRIVAGVGLPRLTANTITETPALEKEMERVRLQGYAIDDQEYGIGVRGVAAPIFDRSGRVVASLSASGSVFELQFESSDRTNSIIAAVKDASLEVSRVLGYAYK